VAIVMVIVNVALAPREVWAQAPTGTPWPVVTAVITPPRVSVSRQTDVSPTTRATAVPLAPITEEAVLRRSTWWYVVVGLIGAIGVGMYGWSAWKRLRTAAT
jgi:hypothetical protein